MKTIDIIMNILENEGMDKRLKDNVEEKKSNNKGITLIALVVTIVIMLILAGVALNIALKENGLFGMSKNAVAIYKKAQTNEQESLGEATNIISSESESDVNETKGTIEINGQVIPIEKGKIEQYYGKIVTNYKQTSSTENIITVNYQSYTFSQTYRLFYVDFDNKYGDGLATVYLKADSSKGNYYELLQMGSIATSKIRNLNPSLYIDSNKSTIESPNEKNGNMKDIIYLLDAEKWKPLVESGIDTEISQDVKYAVASPTIEMLFDSYNEHYNLTNQDPSSITEGDGSFKKLCYKYIAGEYGYKAAKLGDEFHTSSISIYLKENDDTSEVYYSGEKYWIASPSAESSVHVFFMSHYLNSALLDIPDDPGEEYCLCPVVALNSNVNLKLQN